MLATRRRQPRQYVQTDPRWGVEFAVCGSFPGMDLSGRRRIQGFSAITTEETPYGAAFTGATSYGATPAFAAPTTDRSCLSIVRYSGAANGDILAQGAGGVAGWGFSLSPTVAAYTLFGVASYTVDVRPFMPDAGAGAAWYPLVQVVTGSTYYAYLGSTKSSGVAIGTMAAISDRGICAFASDNGTLIRGGGSDPLAVLFNYALTDAQAFALLANPWQVFRPINRRVYSFGSGAAPLEATQAETASAADTAITLQALTPASDISNAGSWTPKSGSDLYAMLTTRGSGDYIVSPNNPSGAVCEIKASAGDPLNDTSIGFVPVDAIAIGGTVNLTVALMQGTTEIASRTFAIDTDGATVTVALTAAEVATISDDTDLRWRFTASVA